MSSACVNGRRPQHEARKMILARQMTPNVPCGWQPAEAGRRMPAASSTGPIGRRHSRGMPPTMPCGWQPARPVNRGTTNYHSNALIWFVVGGFSRRYSLQVKGLRGVASRRAGKPTLEFSDRVQPYGVCLDVAVGAFGSYDDSNRAFFVEREDAQ